MSQIKVVKEKSNLEQKTGEYLGTILKENQNTPTLLLLSGGSALKILKFIDPESLGPNLAVGVVDERYSQDPETNNFAQVFATDFFKEAAKKQVQFIDTRVGEKETLTHIKVKFESNLKRWRKENPEGKIIATLGIGEDGHTAGIMPHPESARLFKDLFDDEGEWVVGYDAGEKNKHALRITVSASFLRNFVDKALVFVSGKNKKEALDKVLSEKGSLHETPARIIHEMKDVILFTDIS